MRAVNARRAGQAAAATIVLTPIAWIIGVDQGTWLLVGACIGLAGLRVSDNRPLLALVMAFIAVLGISGLMNAQGVRYLTLAREAVIVASFWLCVLGVDGLVQRGGLQSVRQILLACSAFIAVTSVLSIGAFIFQEPLRFQTPIAPLIPDVIADTGLGKASLVERSLGEPSFFLGQSFVRPQGLFLFSTSQAVAQAILIPVWVAAARWWPAYRRWLLAVIGTSAVALVVSTTRSPILALAGSAGAVWLAWHIARGQFVVRIPLRGTGGLQTLGVSLAAVAALAVAGGLDPVWDVITTRSLGGRTSLYDMTLDTWTRQPLLGWGTEVDWTPRPEPSASPTPMPSPTPVPTPRPAHTPPPEPEDRPPLGSHSQYLGVLFKQGIVGLVLFLLAAFYVGRALLSRRTLGDLAIAALAVSFAASLGIGLLESMWLDPGTALLVGVVWGTVLASRRPSFSAQQVS